MNNCTFIGRLVRDPELKHVGTNSVAMATFTIVVNRRFKSGDKTAEEVNFLDMVAWDKGGETITKYFKKGDLIAVEASAKQEKWTTKENETRSKIVFRVEKFHFVGGGRGNGSSDVPEPSSDEAPSSTNTNNGGGGSEATDEIPF